VNRFYAVLNSVVKVSGRGFENYVAITRKAQREIADTYFIMGDFAQAQKFYNLMLRSDLSEDEKPLIMFKAGHCTFMRDDMAAAMVALEKFIREYPGHEAAPEARYLLAVAQRAQGRTKEAYDTVLDLLRYQRDKKDSDPEKWIFWQKKAGNEFANDYYQRADFVNAVTIYQVLSTLNEAADWRWPIVYQMGLCFERLRLEPRAHECYKHITDSAKKFAGTEMPKSLEVLVQMADWRDGQLDWSRKAGGTLNSLLGAEIKPITVNPAPSKVTR
jgi:tetratricopeptide (TPR) repeat protein